MFFQFLSICGALLNRRRALGLIVFLEVRSFGVIITRLRRRGAVVFALVNSVVRFVILLVLYISSLKSFSSRLPQRIIV
jgi:hypothetical protein